jgi:hypothetical protein
MTQPIVMVSTCGTSVLTNGADPGTAQYHKYLGKINIIFKPNLWKHIV